MSDNEFLETRQEFQEQAEVMRRTQGNFITTTELSKIQSTNKAVFRAEDSIYIRRKSLDCET
jgi:hypothetical protein